MDKNKSRRMRRIFFTLLILLLISLSFFILSETITKYAGFLVFEEAQEESALACIQSKHIFLFINDDDSTKAIASQKIDYVNVITIFNCRRNSALCSSLGITSFPTWVVDSQGIQGDLTQEQLVEFAGC